MTIYLIHKQDKYYHIWRSKSCVFCFKQLSLNIKGEFEFSNHFIDGETLLSVVVGTIGFLTDKRLDFHDTTF